MLTTKITNIAESIRNKTGKTNLLTLDEMPNEINSIKTESKLQDKSIEITENGTQSITADEGYDGLNQVEVTTNIASSSGTQEKGLLIKEYDENGYPTNVEIKDMTINIEPTGLFGLPTSVSSPQSSSCILLRNLKKVVFKNVNFAKGISYMCQYSPLEEVFFDNCAFPTGVNGTNSFSYAKSLKKFDYTNFPTEIGNGFCMYASELVEINLDNVVSMGDNAFSGCSKLNLNVLPNSLKTIGKAAFANCTNLAIKTLPDTVTLLQNSVFQNTGITQMSMRNVTSIYGNLSANGGFYNNKNLKAVWIGSKIASISAYVFSGCSVLTKIFIDLPRATVETMTNYSSKWGATNAEIICNDDAGFMTKDEFDAIDWATYTM